jgi:uncharacterized membrane protein YoaK (UPF0700 family)
MHNRKDFKYIVIGGSLLSLNAAFVNAVFLLSSMQVTVAHVTGTVSKASIDLSKGLWKDAAVVLGMAYAVCLRQ